MATPPRIIAGTYRGRRLVVPPGDTVRPTKDRVKAAIFSALDARGLLTDAVVLDAYAGSGALGLEALSRGAARATFIEHDRQAVAALRHNVEAVGASAVARVLSGDVINTLRAGSHSYDLVFADPPYDLDPTAVGAILEALVACAPGGTVVLERPAREILRSVPNWAFTWERRFGDTLVVFAQPDPAVPDES